MPTPAIPLKSEYGPTLGQLLSPWWRRGSARRRGLLSALGAAIVALILVLGLSLLDASYSHGGPVPFSFRYKHMFRTTPDPGGFVLVETRSRGRLQQSFGVDPLNLPDYEGSVTGEIPMYAADYINRLRAAKPGFDLVGEGVTHLNTIPAYAIAYREQLQGETIYGRDLLIVPDRAHPRQGVIVRMLQRPIPRVDSPNKVGVIGSLQLPATSFSFG